MPTATADASAEEEVPLESIGVDWDEELGKLEDTPAAYVGD